MCQDGNMNLKKNDAFACGNNNANVFKVGGAKVAVENSVIKASLFAGNLKTDLVKFFNFEIDIQ